ncbi:MAG TPA: hypothetical protein VNA30_03915, partial [Mycobacteriales bacterium]|nr:hypothetical protein [Mycobacteriales bacterium]
MKTPVAVLAAALCASLAVPSPAGADHSAVVLAGCTGEAIGLFPPEGGAARIVVPPYAYEPDISPDGKRLAYVGVEDKFSFLFVRDLETGATKRLTDVGWSEPDWAPDGRRIAVSDSSGNGRIGIVDADEAPPQVRLVPGVSGGSPSWSPDGEFLAFSERDYSTSGRVVAVRPDGRDRTSLGVAGTEPAWSPDGREVAYTSGRDLKSVSLPDLTSRYVLQSPLATRAFRAPAWSPDGREIYAEQVDTAGSTRTRRMIRTASNAGAPDAGDPVSGPDSGCPSLGGGHSRPSDTTPPDAVSSLTLQPAPSRIAVTATWPRANEPAGVLVRYRLGEAPPMTPADGIDAGRALTGRTVLRRLQPSTTYSVTVFPLDWAGNVGPGRSAS